MKSRSAANVPFGIGLRSACLIAVAIGIFGMHALANCGMTDMVGMAGMAPTSMTQTADTEHLGSVARGLADGSGQAGMESVTVEAHTVQAGPVEDGSGMGMSLVKWCITVLVTGVGAAVYFTRRARSREWSLPRRVSVVAIIVRVGRHVAARPLSQLSILRC